jgi:hypothetical protein
MPHEKFKDCIDACNACAVACSHCAVACLNEEQVQDLTKCIQLDMECTAICRSAAEMMSLGSEYSYPLCNLCAEICSACAEECEKHAQKGMEHCRICANACLKCATQCSEMAAV